MSQLLKEEYFVCTDVVVNQNKFWRIQLFEDGTLTTRWGRVGVTEQSKSWNFSPSKAEDEYNKKIKDKLKVKTGRDAYTKVDILTSTRASQSVPGSNLADVATREIDTDSETTRDLIRYLSQVNVHNIVSSTTITYNAAEGVFSTPLGVVGQSMLDRARVVLNDIAPFATKQQYDDPAMIKYANEYLRLIPQNLGGGHRKIKLENIFTADGIKKQTDILDALDASIASVLTKPVSSAIINKEDAERPRTFDLKLNLCEDAAQIDEVVKYFTGTKNRMHTSYNCKFEKLYTVSKPDMTAAWEADGAKLSNRKRLWHGTSAANVLSILKQGLVVPKKCTNGWMFGPGIYFSDQSSKSLNYSTGYWTGKNEAKRVFMFLADVGMGNYYVPRSSMQLIPKGYDSFFAQAGKSSVMNNEIIVPRTGMCNLVYLVEFSQ